MKLTTTFNKLRESRACASGYKKLAQHLGGVDKYGADAEINLLTILESNGFDDAVWSLRATMQDADSVKRLIACDFAESVLHIFESKRPGDDRPRKAIEEARGFAAGTASCEDMRKATTAASDAYADAYADAAYAASADASASAADAAYAASAAYAYASYAASYSAADASYAAYAYASASASADAYAYAADAASARTKARAEKKEQLDSILRRYLADE
jgi:hypothetical protein